MLEHQSSSVVSDAAIATLHVHDHLTADLLLTLVVLTASPLQLQVVKDEVSNLSLVAKNGTVILTQRNAILRFIAGMGLHNALDRTVGGTGFLGGYNDSAKASPSAAMAIAEIASWMSVADSIRSLDTFHHDDWAKRINEFLSCRAFLVSAAKPTLADYDVAFAFLQYRNEHSDILASSSNMTHLQRWITQVVTSALDLVQKNQSENSSVLIQSLQRLGAIVVPTKTNHSHVFVFPPDRIAGNVVQQPEKTTAPSMKEKNQNSSQDPDPEGHVKSTPNGGITSESSSTDTKNKDKKKKKSTAETVPPSNNTASTSSDPSPSKPLKVPTPETVDTTKDGKESSDFNISALDIRVGQIIKVWPHESADKLYCEEINLGEDQPRLIASGLRPFYSLEEMQNQRVLVLANLKARNLVGFPSHGMVLCASNHDHTQVEFVVPPDSAQIGERVIFEGYDGSPEPENKVAKKKILELVLPFLQTNDEGIVTWKGFKSITSTGPCVSSMKNAHVA